MKKLIISHLTTAGKTRRAFTLIELLVVIAIIAILAAILFPVFGRARENARRTACLSNMKQVGLGVLQYIQDYDEKYPVQEWPEVTYYATSTNSSVPTINWMVAINPYIKSTQLYICPSAKDFNASGTSDTNYVGNGVVFQHRRNTGSPLSTGAIGESASIILVQEQQYRTMYSLARPFLTDDTTKVYGYWLTDNSYSSHHFEGGNLLFADGHAKWRKTSSICAKEYGINNNSCGDILGTAAGAYTGTTMFN